MFIISKTKCSLQDKSQSFIIIINTKSNPLYLCFKTVKQIAVSVAVFIYQKNNAAFYQIYSLNAYVHPH